MAKEDHAPGFRITNGKGFHVTFENGHTVSVQFGGGNYSSNYDLDVGTGRDGEALPLSATAEIAAWGPEGWHRLGDGDDVAGYQTPADVLAIMTTVAGLQRSDRLIKAEGN